jgi:hypothetical protein
MERLLLKWILRQVAGDNSGSWRLMWVTLDCQDLGYVINHQVSHQILLSAHENDFDLRIVKAANNLLKYSFQIRFFCNGQNIEELYFAFYVVSVTLLVFMSETPRGWSQE